ncbi:MAG TPA: hypothetical protein VLN57_12045 [Xanthobacteraceae bacterium]|nr:hypothetical protein [Xanthobacteraceae bacterium]
MLPLEQQRMHFRCFGCLDHDPDVHVDRVSRKADLVRADAKTFTIGLGKDVTQFTNDLAEHRTRLCFARLAPKQSDQFLACFEQ